VQSIQEKFNTATIAKANSSHPQDMWKRKQKQIEKQTERTDSTPNNT
jgi:hypothetical protein